MGMNVYYSKLENDKYESKYAYEDRYFSWNVPTLIQTFNLPELPKMKYLEKEGEEIYTEDIPKEMKKKSKKWFKQWKRYGLKKLSEIERDYGREHEEVDLEYSIPVIRRYLKMYEDGWNHYCTV